MKKTKLTVVTYILHYNYEIMQFMGLDILVCKLSDTPIISGLKNC